MFINKVPREIIRQHVVFNGMFDTFLHDQSMSNTDLFHLIIQEFRLLRWYRIILITMDRRHRRIVFTDIRCGVG